MVVIDISNGNRGHGELIGIGRTVEHPEQPVEGDLLDVMSGGLTRLEIENCDVVTFFERVGLSWQSWTS